MMSLSPLVLATVPVYNSTQKTITVVKSQPTFSIQLNSNPTTGYRWDLLTFDAKLIQPMENHYVAPKTQLVGAGGYEVWTFKVLPAGFTRPQVTFIRMQYARPWQGGETGSRVVFKIATQP